MNALVRSAVESGLCDESKVWQAIHDSNLSGLPILDHLCEKLPTVPESFCQLLAQYLELEYVSKVEIHFTSDALLKAKLPPGLALKYRILPLKLLTPDAVEDQEKTDEPQTLVIATYDPFNLGAKQEVARKIPLSVRWCLTSRDEILRNLQSFYGVGADTFEDLINSREFDTFDDHLRDEANIIDDDDTEASVIKFVNQIIREALSQRATDIHVEPLHDHLRIRYRIDGVLHEAPVPEKIKSLQASVLARIKVMAKLDIAEKRLPQDGRISLQLEGENIDVRVACIPSVEGESISMRLLGQEKFNLSKLGLSAAYLTKVESLLAKPNGIVLVTGPTGSGKSTTLYSFLSELNSVQRRIVTIEDPVENKLPGVVQIAVKPEINLTFATGLRSILRGDPNVVMVGEIRDLETAEIAVRASLTGHLVFSTLHTNDAIGGITRLVEMGVEPFLVSSSVRAFIAQRLVRTLCKKCRVPANYSKEQLDSCGFPDQFRETIFSSSLTGCQACRNTGFHGRQAIYEIVMVTNKLQDLISDKAGASQLLRQARNDGFISMREYGWQKVSEGITTLEEVMRVTSEDFLE